MGHLLNGVNSLWIFDIFNKLCLVLDAIIYTVAGWLFNTFYSLAGMSIINEFKSFALIFDRIKLLIGIFALFILVKSLLANLIDPDKAVVESSKIVKNIGIAIVLLITIPEIFNILNGFQTAVVGSNAIPKLVLNEEMVENAQVEDGSFVTMNNVGNILMNNVFLLFFKYKGFEFGDFTWTTDSNLGGLFKDLGEALSGIESEAFDAVGEGAPILVLFPYTNSSNVYYEYPVISGIVGLVFCYYFIQIAVTIGIRMFKLFALQVIAPIPIILSINPSQHSTLSNYFKYLSKTYSDLFIRLFCVMLVYPVIFALVKEIEPETGNLVIKLILIFALLKFVKEVPKMLSEILNLNINMSEKGPGGFLGGIFGAGAGLAAGLVTAKMGHLSGRDFASHAFATSVKGAREGYLGGQKGISGFGASMAGVATGGFVAANQIYNSGGYGNYVKGRLLNKFGAGEYIKNENERLSDALTNATQTKEKYEDYRGRLSTLKSEAQRLYDARHNGGLAGNVDYQAQLAVRKSAAERLARNAKDSKAREMFAKANTAINDIERDYRTDVGRFYDRALNGSDTSSEATTLRSISDKISKEIRDADQSINLSTYDGINNAEAILDDSIVVADHNVDTAQRALKEFKDKNIYKYSTFDAGKSNKYKSKNSSRQSSQSGSEQGNSSGGAQQGQAGGKNQQGQGSGGQPGGNHTS